MQMFGEIPDFLIAWLDKQHMFWVASAPLTADGLVNISPKGVEGTFHIASPRRVWYEDLSGSGVETISHIRENQRMTILFNAFEGPPRIVRLYGKGSIFEFGTSEYNVLLPEGVRHPGSRAAIVLDIFKVATTCGYSVPIYEFKAHRTQLLEWAAKKEAADRGAELTVGFSSATSPRVHTGLKRWWEERNTTSLDGLQGIVSAHMSEEVFRSCSIKKSSSYEVPTIRLKVIRAFDFGILCAFLVGILVTCLYQRVALITKHLIFIN